MDEDIAALRARLEAVAVEDRSRSERRGQATWRSLTPDQRSRVEGFRAASYIPGDPNRRRVFIDRFSVIGCSEAEIEISATQGVELPDSFKVFLRVMGKSAAGLYIGSEWLYPLLLDLKTWALECLEENGSLFDLPDNALVGWMHGGYQFAWLEVGTGADDPPVWYWIEGRPAPTEPRWNSWLDFLVEGEALHCDFVLSL